MPGSTNPPTSPKADPAKAPEGTSPNTTIVVISDDGAIYKLTKDEWTKGEKLTGDAALLAEKARAVGSFLAVPPPLGVGIGVECTIVNLEAVLKKK